jgi:Tfp pilus assembly protein PilV
VSADVTRRDAGSALVESLVALVLIAIAGLVVATAATTGLRATHRAATLTRTTALAARELARLASRRRDDDGRDATTTSRSRASAIRDAATDVTRDGDSSSSRVTVDRGRRPSTCLATQRPVRDR